MSPPQKVLTVRDATFAPCKTIDVGDSLGEVLADLSVGCPPAVPIVVCGEKIDSDAIDMFAYYNISKVTVVK